MKQPPPPWFLLTEDIGFALLPPVALLSLHLARMALVPDAIQLDMVAHFFGGFSIAWMGWILWRRWTAHGWIPKQTPWWIRDTWTWGMVALIGIAWEVMEWASDHWLGTIMQPSLFDTMHDYVMDLCGGFLLIGIACVFFGKKK